MLFRSHHGELEYGSPKVPLFPEAMLLHHLDNLDSKMECMRALAANDRRIEGSWTSYSPSLDRSILKKAKYLEDAPAREALSDPVPVQAPSPIHAPVPDPAALPNQAPEPPIAVHHQQRFNPSGSPFAEKLQQAWRKDP